MAKVLQHRRGTSSEHANFTGAEGEITVNTTETRIVVHDGATAGGVPMAKESEVLKNTGGTMTGAVAFGVANAIKKSADDSALYIHGSTAEGNGAHLMLCGKNHSTNAGQARLVATDGTNTKTLRLSPDGSAQWDGKEILTNANGLPLAGGTMTGELVFSGNRAIKQTATSNRIQIYGGTTADTGSMIGVYGNDYTDRPGWVYLRTTDGTTGRVLVIKPDGVMMWDSKHVVRSVNGTEADASGDVTLDTFTAPVQIASWSLSLYTNATTTKTLSGLTPYKPVFAVLVGTRGSFLAPIASGECIQITNDYGPTQNKTVHRVLWPISTSLTITYKGNYSDVTSTGTVTFYQ